jgi:hypothetical protein
VAGEFTRWTVTGRALRVGLRGSSEGRLRELAPGPMRELRDRTDETVTLQVRDGDRMVLSSAVGAAATAHHADVDGSGTLQDLSGEVGRGEIAEHAPVDPDRGAHGVADHDIHMGRLSHCSAS